MRFDHNPPLEEQLFTFEEARTIAHLSRMIGAAQERSRLQQENAFGFPP